MLLCSVTKSCLEFGLFTAIFLGEGGLQIPADHWLSLGISVGINIQLHEVLGSVVV